MTRTAPLPQPAAALLILLLGARSPGLAQESPHRPIHIPCAECHTTSSWNRLASPMQFDHRSTGFPLAGQHLSVSCRHCHATLTFSEARRECASCHTDLHRGELGAACERCHTTQTWLVPDMSQRHGQTRFPLSGPHVAAQCEQCHQNRQPYQYIGTPTECFSCHQSDYQATLQPAHAQAGFGTNCVQCHSLSSLTWGTGFDHARTGFPLIGAHAGATCASCHAGNRFGGLPTDCYSCHQADYAAAANPIHTTGSFPTTCATCHSSTAWHPASFQHDGFFPISSGSKHRPGRWNSCADCHPAGGSFTAFSCLTCHEHDQARMASAHSGRANYRYESQACYSCHPRGN
jgi:hypothetical protein